MTVDGIFAFTGLRISLTNFNLTVGAGGVTTTAGSILVEADTLALFPGNGAFTAVATVIFAEFPLENPLGALRLGAAEIVFEFGGVIRATGTGPLLDLDATEIFVLPSLVLEAIDLPELGTATLLNLVVTRTGFSFDSFTLGQIGSTLSIGTNPVFIEATDFVIAVAAFNFTVGQPASFVVTASATTLALFPTASGGALGRATNIAFRFDGNGDLTATFADVLTANFLNLHLYLGNAPNIPVFAVASAQVRIAALGDVALTLAGLQVARDGSVSLSSAEVSSASGLFGSFGLGGLLPFEITSIRLLFPVELPNGRRSLDSFNLEVTGSFDQTAFGGLPFTPIIEVGGVLQQSGGNFRFLLHVGSLVSGTITPRDIGPIRLGFTGWDIGLATVSALIELGLYDSNGVLHRLPGLTAQVRATFTVTSSTTGDLEIGATAQLLGNFTSGPAGAVLLNLIGSFNVGANGGVIAGKVRIDFTGRITTTPPAGAVGWSVEITGQLARITITDIVIRIGDVLEITALSVSFGDDPGTPAIEVFSSTQVSVRLLAYTGIVNFSITLGSVVATTTTVRIDDLVVGITGAILPAVFTVANLRLLIDASFNYTKNGDTYTVSNLGGNATLSANSISIFPNAPGGALFSATGIAGFFDDNSGEITLTAATATANVANTFALSFTGLQFYFGSDTARNRVSISTTTATFAGLPAVSINLTGFRVSNGGYFGIDSASANAPNGLFQTLGLGGILPFDITGLTFVFTDQGPQKNLANFRLEVTGTFNTGLLAALPFTPIISIGGVTSGFAFSVTFNNGVFAPFNVADITLGFSDLAFGSVTIGAQITLGGYVGGVFQNSYGGSISVSGFEGGAVALTLGGSLSGNRLAITGTLTVSFTLGGIVDVTGASLSFSIDLVSGVGFAVAVENLAFTAGSIARLVVRFGELFSVETTNTQINFGATGGAPLISFRSVSLLFGPGTPAAGWGGTVGNFAVGSDFRIYLLNGFFFTVDIGDTPFGLPDFLPVSVTGVGFRFLDNAVAAPGGAVAGGSRLENITDLVLILSGGVGANANWPISASFTDLEISLGKLLAGQFPIVDLAGIAFDVPRFTLGDAEIGGTFAIGSVTVNAGTPQERTAYYVQLGRSFVFGGLDLGITIAFSQYGPLAAIVGVPLAVPLGPTGLILQSVTGALSFGGAPWPSVVSPLELLTNPVFHVSTTLTLAEITSRLTAVLNIPVEANRFTWTRGFTISLTATITTLATPGILTGDLTLAANIGFGAGGGLRWIASGNLKLFGIELGAAALMIDLSNPLTPRLDFAFSAPTPGNPLAFILPAQGQFTVSLRTDGVLEAPILGMRVFLDRLVAGTLGTGQTYFSGILDALAARLDADRNSRIVQLLLAGAPPPPVITAAFLMQRLVGAGGLLPADFTGINAQTVTQVGELAYLLVGGLLRVAGDNPQAGFDALGEFSLIVQNAVGAAVDAGWAAFNPGFALRGFLQPTIFGFPFGQPTNAVELILDKNGISFALTTSIIASVKRSLDLISANVGPTLATLIGLGFEDRVEMGFTLRFPDVGRFAKLLQGGSIIEPGGAVQLIDFLVDTINPFANWEVLFRGELLVLGFKVGEISGLFFGPQVDQSGSFAPTGLFASRVVNLDPDNDGRPNPDLARSVDNGVGLIPVTTNARYQDLMRWGGVLLTAQLFMPKILKDPVEVLTQDVDWTPNGLNFDDPFAAINSVGIIGDWLNELVADLTADQAWAKIQFYFPSPAMLFDPSSYLEGGAGGSMPSDDGTAGGYQTSFRIKPIDATLRALLIDAMDSAYVEGFVEVELLSITFGRMDFDLTTSGLRLTGEIPWLSGLRGSFTIGRQSLNVNQLVTDLVQSPLTARLIGPLVGVPSGNGAAVGARFAFLSDPRVAQVSLPYPVAGLEVTVSSAPLAQWLSDSLGLPASIFSSPGGNASAISFGAYTPGFGATGVQRYGGFSLSANASIAGLVSNASFLFEIELFNFTGGIPLPNFVARASVASFTIPGLNPQGTPANLLSLTNAFAEIRRTTSGVTVGLGGNLRVLNSFDFSLSGALTILINDPNPGMFGELAMTAVGGGAGTVSGNLFSLAGSFVLQINTTGVERIVDRPGVAAANDPRIAANSAFVRADGTLTLGPLVFTGFFRLSLVPAGLHLESFSTITVAPLGTFAATGIVILAATGIVGRFEFDAGAAVSKPGAGWVLNARFYAEINTRSTAATVPRITVSTTDGSVSLTTTNITIGAQTVRIFAAGSLLFRQGSAPGQTDGFTLQGGFEVGVAPGVLTFNSFAFVQLLGLGSMATTGAFQFTSLGAAGIVSLGAALGNTSATTRSGTGYSFDGRFRMEINTTGAVVNNVGGSGENLSSGRYVRVAITGANQADPATLTLGAFRFSARFSLEAGTATVGASSAAVLQITATNATLAVIGLNNATLFSMSANGALLLSTSGIAAKITLGGTSTSGPGYSLSGGFTFELNTTNLAIPTIGVANVNLADGPYTRVAITGVGGTGNGTLTVGGMNVVGTFVFTAGQQTIGGTPQMAVTMVANATLNVDIGTLRVFDLDVNSALYIHAGGVAARFNVGFIAGPSTVLRLDLDTTASSTFTFEVNTSAVATTVPGSAVTIAPGVRVVANGAFMVNDDIRLSGAFTFFAGTRTVGGVSQAVIVMSFDGSARMNAADLRVFVLVVESNFVIFSSASGSGIAGRFTVDLFLGPSSSLGFSLGAGMTFSLRINTSGAAVSIGAGTLIDPGARVVATGSIGISGFTLTGVFTFTVGLSFVSVSADASISFLGATLSLEGTIRIFGGADPGIVVSLALSRGSDTTPNITEVPGFDITGSMALQLNSRNAESLNVAGNTFRVRVTSASVTISTFTLTGSANFVISSGLFRADVSMSASLWGYKTVTFSGYIRSDGYFNLDATTNVNLSSGGNGFSGTLVVGLTRNSSGYSFSGDADGTLSIFGVTLASFDGWVNSSGQVKFTISILGFSGTIGFDLANGGSFFDGPVAGATVFFDANLNRILDVGEPFALTDADGNYNLNVPLAIYDLNGNGVLDPNEGQIVGFGGVDTFTGLPIKVPVRALAGSLGTGVPTLLSPVSSLFVSLLESGLNITDAEAIILRATGLNSVALGLLSVRDIKEDLLTGAPDAFEFFRLGAQLQTASEQLAALLDGVAGVSAAGVADAFYEQLAAQLAASRSARSDTVLGTSRGAASLVRAINTSLGITLTAGLLDGAAQVIAAVYDRIDSVALTATGLSDVARVQIVGQGTSADALRGAGAGTTPIATVVTQFTGAGLTTKINETPPPIITLPPIEPPPPPEVVVTPLPDGTQKIVVTPRLSEVILDAQGQPIVDPTLFQLTVPVIGTSKLKVTRLVIDADTGVDGPQFIEVRTSINGFSTVVARVATVAGSSTYTINLVLPEGTAPVTIRIAAVEPTPVVQPGEDDPPVVRDEGFLFTRVSAEGILSPVHTTPRLADHLASRGASPVAISKVPQDKYLPVTPGENGKAFGRDKKLLPIVDPSIGAAPPIEPPPPPPSLPKPRPGR